MTFSQNAILSPLDRNDTPYYSQLYLWAEGKQALNIKTKKIFLTFCIAFKWQSSGIRERRDSTGMASAKRIQELPSCWTEPSEDGLKGDSDAVGPL